MGKTPINDGKDLVAIRENQTTIRINTDSEKIKKLYQRDNIKVEQKNSNK